MKEEEQDLRIFERKIFRRICGPKYENGEWKTGRDEKKGKTQEKMGRGNRERASSAGSEKMERVGGK
jgi:hypothetical protein